MFCFSIVELWEVLAYFGCESKYVFYKYFLLVSAFLDIFLDYFNFIIYNQYFMSTVQKVWENTQWKRSRLPINPSNPILLPRSNHSSFPFFLSVVLGEGITQLQKCTFFFFALAHDGVWSTLFSLVLLIYQFILSALPYPRVQKASHSFSWLVSFPLCVYAVACLICPLLVSNLL